MRMRQNEKSDNQEDLDNGESKLRFNVDPNRAEVEARPNT